MYTCAKVCCNLTFSELFTFRFVSVCVLNILLNILSLSNSILFYLASTKLQQLSPQGGRVWEKNKNTNPESL